ncbi:MAG: DUF1592 domain-containing protein [Verrucomicrobiales bacterium]|nr:DUF1592 domain-containing protein [Verrucomicrobiales bacterium]
MAFLFRSLQAAPDFEKEIQPFLDRHCVRCHDADKQKGDFRIDELSREIGLKDTPLWAEVMERIRSGEMPPDDEEILPTPDESAAVVEWLSARISEGEASRMAARDKVSFHRLSREEYTNTVKDLLGVHFTATDPGGFSDDPEYHGFERIGSVLTLSASHIEKYFEAAESILSEAWPEKEPEIFEMERMAVDSEKYPESQIARLEKNGAENFRFEVWPQDKFRYANPGRLPVSGIYEMSITLSGLKPTGGRSPRLHVYHEDLDRVLFAKDVVAPENEPVTLTFRTHLPAGNQKIMVWNDVPGPSNLPRSGRHGRRPFISTKDGRMPWQIKLTDEDGQPLYPFLIIDKVSWRGPIMSEEEARLRTACLPKDCEDPGQVVGSLAALAKRAFRRPLKRGELEKYVNIYTGEIDAGESPQSALKASMLAILCSKSFLFLEEGSETEERQVLNNWEIASRLSYFLWSTMPDEELFALAEAGQLQDPEVRRDQFSRMVNDHRAQRFSDSFSRQWLRLNKVGMFAPDKNLYPDYDKHLEQSMIGESQAFFAEMMRNDRSLRNFIESDWTMINPRLALHYGMKGIEKDEFQRVSLQENDQRGGLLTQAAILSLTSDGTRHRPVHRGVWLSETIFGKTPPPPPANVDPVEPNPVDSPKATFREKLEAHKADQNCASCHKKIDPYGLAFENYDAIGRWRTREVVQKGIGDNPFVDAGGMLPDGREFSDVGEFKKLLLEDIDVFCEAFVSKLATYGMRRPLTFDDENDLAVIVENAKGADYQLRAIVEAFVTSDLFQKR